MSTDADPILMPQDLEACHALIKQLTQQVDSQAKDIQARGQVINAQSKEIDAHTHLIDTHAKTITELTEKITKIEQEKAELHQAWIELLQERFRKRSERYIEDSRQLKLDFGDNEESADAAEGLAEATEEAGVAPPKPEKPAKKPSRKPRRDGLPPNLPRYEVEAPVPDEVRFCPIHGEREIIDYDTTETLEFTRPKLRVRVTKYPKFACRNKPDCGVKSPGRPQSLVEGERYDASMAAEIITAKHGFHMPVYRQQDYFAGCGWTPNRSTILNILTASAAVIRPLIDHFKAAILGDSVNGTDATRVTLLLPKIIPPIVDDDPRSQRVHEVMRNAADKGERSVSARMWAYRGVSVPLQVFVFTVSRHRDGPTDFFDGYRGTIMADCYSGYQGITLRSDGQILRAACNAHARRKIHDAREVQPLEASILLAKFQQLYDIEDRGRTLSPEARRDLRQGEAQPVWDSLRQWLDSDAAAKVLPKSKLGEAIGYLNNQWDALTLYLMDGLVPLTNNDVEQLMKQIAVGRNYAEFPIMPS